MAMCTSRYYGVPNEICKLQAKTLRNSIFRIRTALGDSIKTYKHNNDTPIFGTGQGSCASPAIWLLISSSRYIPAMLYTLPAMCYNEEKTNCIQQPAMGKFLQVCGYEKNFPRAVTYGTTHYGGLAMPQLYVESSICKIQTLLTHVNTNTELGELIRVDLNWLQMCCGISENILNTNKLLPYIDANWFISIKDFLNITNATIEIKNLWKPNLKRENDKIVMDEINKLCMTKQELQIFNNWRIFFKITTIAELCNQPGTHVRNRFLSRSSSMYRLGKTDMNWPNQERPDNKYFNIWLRGITTITDMQEDTRLGIPALGKWTSNINDTNPDTKFMLHKNKQILAIRDETTGKWYQHLKHHEERSTLFFEKETSIDMPDMNNTEFDTIEKITEHQYFQINTRNKQLNRTKRIKQNRKTTHNDLEKEILEIQDWSTNLIKNTKIINESKWLSSKNKQLIVATDAGVRKEKGGFGVVMSIDGEVILENNNRIPLIYNELHSYRSEGVGILCGVALLQKILQVTKEQGNEIPMIITLQSDSESMIKSIIKYRYRAMTPKMSYLPEMDIISEIVATIRTLEKFGRHIQLQHVKGHQDRTNDTLNNDAKMNIRADELATESLQMKNAKPLDLPHAEEILKINGELVTSKQSSSLRQIFHSTQMREFLNTSNKWTGPTIDNIWWKIHGPCIETMGKEKTTIYKFIHNRLPCNERNNLYYPYKPSKCTMCPDINEDQMHFLKCKNCMERNKRRDQFFKEIKTTLYPRAQIWQ
jgi:hypothetical protein